MKRFVVRIFSVIFFALALAGCVDSTGPILPDSEEIFGKRIRLQFYNLDKGFARDQAQATFNWNGALYANSGPGMRDVSAFSVHRFEAGEYIIQSVPAKRARITEYALLRQLTEGVFQLFPIDEADADEPTRAAYCTKADKSPCRIETREQLYAFARATAARRKDGGGLAIRLPDGLSREPQKERPARRPPPPPQRR